MYVQRKRWHILLFWNVITVSIKIVQLLLTDLFFPLYKKSWSWDSFDISLDSWRMCIMKSQVIFWGDENYFESPVHFVFSAPDSNWRIINMILFFFLHVVHTHCTTWQYYAFQYLFKLWSWHCFCFVRYTTWMWETTACPTLQIQDTIVQLRFLQRQLSPSVWPCLSWPKDKACYWGHFPCIFWALIGTEHQPLLSEAYSNVLLSSRYRKFS